MRPSTILSLFASAISLTSAKPLHSHHQEVANRARADVDVHKRQSFTNARFTWYNVGLGACGITSQPTDFVVALNSDQWGSGLGYPNPNCFKMISITYGGLTLQAEVLDECPGCPYGGLDLSHGLFTEFAPDTTGVIYGSWSFDD